MTLNASGLGYQAMRMFKTGLAIMPYSACLTLLYLPPFSEDDGIYARLLR